MGFYRDRILPYLIHFAMRQRTLAAYRQRVIPAAAGVVAGVGLIALSLPRGRRSTEHYGSWDSYVV